MRWDALRTRREFLATLGGVGLALWTHRIARSAPRILVTDREPHPKSAAPLGRGEPIDGFDVAIAGGRVIDPETRLDKVTNVGIKAGVIQTVSDHPLRATRTIDATGMVVSPGFIDNLSYEPNHYGVWFKIADGVTTTLGMHGLDGKAKTFFDSVGGVPVNYGGAFDDPWWRDSLGLGAYKAPGASDLKKLTEIAEAQLRDGFIGIDVEPEYDPGTSYDEILALARVAKRHDMPMYFHVRYADDVPPGTNAEAIGEVLAVAKATGAAVHVDHINSTGGTFTMHESLETLAKAREHGVDVTACIYPYNFWSTFLASARFNPGWQQRFHMTYADLEMPDTGERLTAPTFKKYQRQNRVVVAHAIPEADVVAALQAPFVMLGSDSILVEKEGRHPRGAGAFARTLGRYVREQKVLTLMDALAKMTILPAQRVEKAAPAMKRKGRLQAGMDADVTIFDAEKVIDNATVRNPRQYSTGIEWVLVGGNIVKDPSGVHKNVLPGKPITSAL